MERYVFLRETLKLMNHSEDNILVFFCCCYIMIGQDYHVPTTVSVC